MQINAEGTGKQKQSNIHTRKKETTKRKDKTVKTPEKSVLCPKRTGQEVRLQKNSENILF